MRSFVLALCLLTVSFEVHAEDKAIRRDPKGITGVSPVWEVVVKGDALAVAKDLDGALAVYREAIAKGPEHPLGHYRVGQIFVLKGDLAQAEAAYKTALGFAGADASLKARILFCLADIEERRKAVDAAIAAWAEFQAQGGTNEKLKVLSASAAERKKRNEDWKKNSADSAEVKQRIEKRAKDGQKSAR